MEHLTALMILIGCSGPSTCQQMPLPAPHYETVAQCQAQLKPALMAAVKEQREVYGTCADVGRAALERDASVLWDLSKDGRITVSVVDGDQEMAERGSIVASR